MPNWQEYLDGFRCYKWNLTHTHLQTIAEDKYQTRHTFTRRSAVENGLPTINPIDKPYIGRTYTDAAGVNLTPLNEIQVWRDLHQPTIESLSILSTKINQKQQDTIIQWLRTIGELRPPTDKEILGLWNLPYTRNVLFEILGATNLEPANNLSDAEIFVGLFAEYIIGRAESLQRVWFSRTPESALVTPLRTDQIHFEEIFSEDKNDTEHIKDQKRFGTRLRKHIFGWQFDRIGSGVSMGSHQVVSFNGPEETKIIQLESEIEYKDIRCSGNQIEIAETFEERMNAASKNSWLLVVKLISSPAPFWYHFLAWTMIMGVVVPYIISWATEPQIKLETLSQASLALLFPIIASALAKLWSSTLVLRFFSQHSGIILAAAFLQAPLNDYIGIAYIIPIAGLCYATGMWLLGYYVSNQHIGRPLYQPLKATPMQHKLSPGPLHNAQGQLAEAGYATDEARSYSRAGVKAPKFRLKEWDYYAVLAGDYGFACVVADNGYMSLHSATWFDFTTGTPTAIAAIGALPMGKLNLPASADVGDIHSAQGGVSLSFTHEAAGRRLKVHAPKWNGGKGFSADVLLHQPQDLDRMTIATPFAENPKAFYYNQKINCMGAEGQAVVDGKTYAFNPAQDFGVLDWGRGVWTYDNTWYWGSASGLQNGKPFGFNIGHGFGDTSAATENMVFVDGRAHKLDEVTFHLPAQGFMDEWTFTSNDGRFEMTFTPILDRQDNINLVVLRSIGHQVFGHFNGHVVLDDGTKMEVTNLLGFAEEIKNRW